MDATLGHVAALVENMYGGSQTKKHGLVVTSEKVGDKRTYSIKG